MRPIIIKALLLIAAAGEVRPRVKVNVIPRNPIQGQKIQVQAIMTDDEGNQKRVAAIYMRILDSTGNVIYPTSVMARQQAGMVIDISTREFPADGYVLQVSNHDNFSPAATTTFKVREPELPLPPLIFPVVFTALNTVAATFLPPPLPTSENLKERVQIAPLIPTNEDINKTEALRRAEQEGKQKVQWHTQEDSKVCPICENLDGRVYDLDDATKPEIPAHPNCRCFWDYVTV